MPQKFKCSRLNHYNSLFSFNTHFLHCPTTFSSVKINLNINVIENFVHTNNKEIGALFTAFMNFKITFNIQAVPVSNAPARKGH